MNAFVNSHWMDLNFRITTQLHHSILEGVLMSEKRLGALEEIQQKAQNVFGIYIEKVLYNCDKKS